MSLPAGPWRGRVVVLGLGRSGLACARTLAREGWSVLVADAGDGDIQRARAAELPPGVQVQLGGYARSVVDGADMVCPSPGVAWDAPELQRARAAGIAVRSEMDLVFERSPAPIVGITGTNGKTTTTALTGRVLAADGAQVTVGGNIGETVLDRLDQVAAGGWLVLELSSFQLESIGRPRCRLAAVLNLTPDHLDRHGSMEAYAAAKRRLVEYLGPDGTAVLNHDDPITRAMAGSAGGTVHFFGSDLEAGAGGLTVLDGQVVSREAGGDIVVLPVTDIPLFGPHNVANVLAAAALGRAAGISAGGIAAAVRGFRAVSHRLEPVLERAGVLWVNDSKATNPDAAIMALRSFDRPIVWIGGGGSKGIPPQALAQEVAARARHAVLNGATAGELEEALRLTGFEAITRVDTLAEAVRAAHDLAIRGDVVLLAPGYTSFDQFSGYDARGRAFAATVVGATGGANGGDPPMAHSPVGSTH